MSHLQCHARLLARPSHRLAHPPVWAPATRWSFPAATASQTISQTRLKCSGSTGKSQHAETRAAVSPPSMGSPSFWASKPVWRRAGVNTLRCLVGCTIGDFSSMWYLQAFYPDMGIEPIMAISMACGVSTSMLLETALLRYGRDRLPWLPAAKTAAGMSMISMLTMEMAQNMVDYHLTGGVVQFDSPSFWAAALVSIAAGFLTPLPYNYLRLRKYGKSCH